MARKTFIAGNWKMNKTAAETKALAEALKESLAKFGDTVTMAVCPTFTSLAAAVEVLKGSNVKVGAQNIHWADNGAFTGEISGAMLKEIGVEYVIIGHSERRQYFGETDETVNKRIKAALKYELKPIVCIGETLAEREGGKTNDVLAVQLKGSRRPHRRRHGEHHDCLRACLGDRNGQDRYPGNGAGDPRVHPQDSDRHVRR